MRPLQVYICFSRCCRCKWRIWICRSFYTPTPIAPASAAAPALIFFHSVGCDWTDPRQIYHFLCMRSEVAYDDVNKCDSHKASAAESGRYCRQTQLTHSTPLSSRHSSTRRLLIHYHDHWLAGKHNVMLTSLSFPKRCIFVNCVY